MKKISLILLFFLSISVLLHASPGTEVTINWLKGNIQAKGTSSITIHQGIPVDKFTGKRTSFNTARMDAYSRAAERTSQALIKALLNLKVDSQYHMKDVLREHEISRSRLIQVIEKKLVYIEKPRGYYDSECMVTINMNDLIDVVPFMFPGDPFPSRMDNPIATDYTSLIIDARGLEIKPMLFPSVYDNKGIEIYGRNFIDIDAAARHGMASYVYTEKEALNLKRAGERPFFTAAIKNLNECPVISNNAARKILSSKKTLERLKKCHVILIIDRKG